MKQKHKVIIKQVITTEIVVDANCADEALEDVYKRQVQDRHHQCR